MPEQHEHEGGQQDQRGAGYQPGADEDFGKLAVSRLAKSKGQDTYAEQHWKGDFSDYLNLVKASPEVTRNAYQRLRDMILSHGTETYEVAGEKIVRYKFFNDPFSDGKNAVYGLDREIMNLMRKIDAAARGYGIEKRIVLLKGPVGSAKSTIAELFKRGLEQYSRQQDGALYTFGWIQSVNGEAFNPKQHFPLPKDAQVAVKWSPMNEDPLNLIPREDLPEVLGSLNDGREKGEFKVGKPVGLSAPSRREFVDLMEQYNGDLTEVLKHVQVKRISISEADRVGIGTFQPKDPKDQDASELTGELNFKDIAVYGDDSDPRAFNFNGELCVSNRGLFEGIEILKVGTEFLYEFLTAAQERQIKPKKFAQTPIDVVLLGHTNEPEYNRLVGNRRMEALVDRLVRVPVPYNTAVTDETRIYEKDFTEEIVGKHVAPHTLEVAAMIAVISRLYSPDEEDTTALVHKMKLYDGETVEGYNEAEVRKLREAALESNGEFREAHNGLSPRFIQNALSECLTDATEFEGIDPLKVISVLKRNLRDHPFFGAEEIRKGLEARIQAVYAEYLDIIKNEVQTAIAGDEKALQRLCSNYIENVDAYTNSNSVRNKHTGQEEEPDERLMRSIETKIDIDEGRKDDFRREIMNTIGSLALDGKTFEFNSNPRLLKALRKKLFEDTRDTGRLPVGTGAHIDPETQDKIDVVKKRLKEVGYNDHSATTVMNLVSSILARGESSD